MKEQRFNELLDRWIDGDITADDSRTMEAGLREDPARARRMREELRFADLLEQQLCPWRSFEAFVNGLEARQHSERTGEEFIRDLIPKLREVDRRMESTQPAPVPFRALRMERREPARARSARWWWPAMGGGLAAAAAVAWLLVVQDGVQWSWRQAPVASITEMEGVVWESEEESIEWKVGDQLKPGEGVRLLSGKARFLLGNGNYLTVEGPADLEFLSESEGILRKGAVLAEAGTGGGPFRVHGLGAEIVVEPGISGVRLEEGDRVEAKLLSKAEAAPAPGIAPPGAQEDPPAVMQGEPGGEQSPVPRPGVLPHYRIDGEGAPMLLVLEDDDLPTLEPIHVDVVPGGEIERALASHENADKRPAIESVSRVRSYLVQLGDGGKGSSRDSEYIDATVRFDRPILGISTMEDTLEMGDQLTGYDPERRLGTAANVWERGLKPSHDFVNIGKDGRTLELRVRKGDGDRVPQLRVFVEGE